MPIRRPRQRVSITEQVVASLAGIAAQSVAGISGLRGNVTDNLKAILGEEHRSRGVIARVRDGVVTITLYVSVEYGYPIHEVAQRLQEHVKDEVESMTGLPVAAVDVYVSDLTLPEGTWSAPDQPQAEEEVGEASHLAGARTEAEAQDEPH
jgi:uncharacterized alkaline shock family protein YloU